MKITRIVSQNKNSRKTIIYVDDAPFLEIYKEYLVDLEVYVGKDVSEEELKNISKRAEYLYWYNRSIFFIGKRPRSIKEVEDYLKKNKVNFENIDLITGKLSDKSFLNDKEFATWWINRSKEYKPKGKRALEFELLNKGISKNIIEDTLKKSELNEESIAYDLANRRLKYIRENDKLKRHKKINDYLIRRGFSWNTIKVVLKKLSE